MTLAEWMIFGTVLLFLLTIAPVKAIGHARFDNSNPRNPSFYKTGINSRAQGAHINGIEAFPFSPWQSSRRKFGANRNTGSTC
jgi:uncharacterized MAPEG superfamily protein